MSTVGSERSSDEINPKYMWNLRLDHEGEERINRLETDGPLDSMIIESYPVCESYLQRKMTKPSFVGHRDRTTKTLVLVHTGVCGTFDVIVKGGYLYLIILTIDYPQYRYIYEKHISEAFKIFKEFKYEAEK